MKATSPENGEIKHSPDARGNPSDYNGYGGGSPDNMREPEPEPEAEPEPRDSPNYGGPESPMHERYRRFVNIYYCRVFVALFYFSAIFTPNSFDI